MYTASEWIPLPHQNSLIYFFNARITVSFFKCIVVSVYSNVFTSKWNSFSSFCLPVLSAAAFDGFPSPDLRCWYYYYHWFEFQLLKDVVNANESLPQQWRCCHECLYLYESGSCEFKDVYSVKQKSVYGLVSLIELIPFNTKNLQLVSVQLIDTRPPVLFSSLSCSLDEHWSRSIV